MTAESDFPNSVVVQKLAESGKGQATTIGQMLSSVSEKQGSLVKEPAEAAKLEDVVFELEANKVAA